MPLRPMIRPPVGKSGPWMIWHSSSMVISGLSRCAEARVDHFAEVVRRNVGRHADGDAAGAVDQQVGKLRRHHRRLEQAVVVVRLEVDRVLVEVVEQVLRRPSTDALRCSARRPAGRRRRSRSCPGRRSAARAGRTPAPCARARRRWRGCRAGGSRPSCRPRPWTTSCASCSSRAPAAAWRRGCAGARASGRRARRAARARR